MTRSIDNMSFQLHFIRCPFRRQSTTHRGVRAVECRVTQSTKTIGELLKIVEDTDRGLETTPSQRRAIDRCVEALQKENEEKVTTGEDMSATWKMLWTTEKELLFVLKNSKWFNKIPGDVFQVLDRDRASLQNVIILEPGSLFAVDAKLEVDGPQRVNFRFEACFYKEADKKPFNLPPFGKGWFENVYLDDEIRIANDIRKDTLITVRDGPPRAFW